MTNPIDPNYHRLKYCAVHSEHSCFKQGAAHAVLPHDLEPKRRCTCPLCKAQYRVGYDLCRGCDADLVFTKEQADAEDVVLFFESADLMGVGELADALKEANVPNYSRFEKGKTKAPLITLFANHKAAKEQSWQIFVLDSDLDRARQVASAARFAGEV